MGALYERPYRRSLRLGLAVGAAARAVGQAVEKPVDIFGRRDTAPVGALHLIDDVVFAENGSLLEGLVFVGPAQPDARSAELLGARPVAIELKL